MAEVVKKQLDKLMDTYRKSIEKVKGERKEKEEREEQKEDQHAQGEERTPAGQEY